MSRVAAQTGRQLEALREENCRLLQDLLFEKNLNNILDNIRNNSLIVCQNCKCSDNENIFKVIKQFNNIYTEMKAKQNLSKLTEVAEESAQISTVRHKKFSHQSGMAVSTQTTLTTDCLIAKPTVKVEVKSEHSSSDADPNEDMNDQSLEQSKQNYSLMTQLLAIRSGDTNSDDNEDNSDDYQIEDSDQEMTKLSMDSNPIEIIECEPSLDTMFGGDDDDDDSLMDSASEETARLWIKAEPSVTGDETVFECNVCHKKFDRKLRLQNHLSKEHKIPGFECDLCEYKANTKYHLNRHKASHSSEKPFQCPVDGCAKFFKTKDYLYEHRKLMHTLKQRFVCQLCDYKTNCKTNFTHHQSRHSTDRPYRCPIVGCNKTFKCKKSLRTHKSPSHMRLSSIQMFECGQCPFVTNSKQKLSIHQNSHKQEAVLECHACQQWFTSELALDEHRRQLHHNKHYFCDFQDCGKSFSSNQYLKTHKRLHFQKEQTLNNDLSDSNA